MKKIITARAMDPFTFQYTYWTATRNGKAWGRGDTKQEAIDNLKKVENETKT